jgi:hypothetical protein
MEAQTSGILSPQLELMRLLASTNTCLLALGIFVSERCVAENTLGPSLIMDWSDMSGLA